MRQVFVQRSTSVFIFLNDSDCLVFLKQLWATIKSIFRYGISEWFGSLTVKSKTQIQSLVKMISIIITTLDLHSTTSA